jgi:hypothetical protein
LNPGIAGIVADRNNDIFRLGWAEALLLSLSRSSDRMRVKLFLGFAGTGRFVAAPGRDIFPDTLADLVSFLLGGEMLTGPPSFLFRVAH